ncbi:MAG: CBS domain-containing protein [bacterium]|nr:CBS domain-containing protein [bacterium]MDT8365441.1 CBS domain-containing protein [bacterium]
MNSRNRGTTPSEAMRVRDVVARHKDRQVPLVRQDAPIAELAQAIAWHRHSRQLYVVDEQDHLLGNITLGRLVMYVFASSHGSSMNPRHVIGLITCKTAGDLMTEGTLSTGMEDEVEEVLERMVAGNLDEIPVINNEGRVVADLTMVDLLMAG